MSGVALLIGCPVGRLRGVEYDLDLMGGMLRERGFRIATCTGKGATRVGIMAALQELARTCSIDEPVVIYYSGHGARVSNPRYEPRLRPHEPRYHRYLVSTDFEDDADSFCGVLTVEIATHVLAISAKTRNVTVVLDCCHTAGTTEYSRVGDALAGVRARSLRGRWTRGGENHLNTLRRKGGGFLNYDLESMHHVVCLTASAPETLAYEESVNTLGIERVCGVFTRALVHVITTGPKEMSWADVQWRLHKILDGRRHSQRPQVQGRSERIIFGGDKSNRYGVVTWLPLLGRSPAVSRFQSTVRQDVRGLPAPVCGRALDNGSCRFDEPQRNASGEVLFEDDSSEEEFLDLLRCWMPKQASKSGFSVDLLAALESNTADDMDDDEFFLEVLRDWMPDPSAIPDVTDRVLAALEDASVEAEEEFVRRGSQSYLRTDDSLPDFDRIRDVLESSVGDFFGTLPSIGAGSVARCLEGKILDLFSIDGLLQGGDSRRNGRVESKRAEETFSLTAGYVFDARVHDSGLGAEQDRWSRAFKHVAGNNQMRIFDCINEGGSYTVAQGEGRAARRSRDNERRRAGLLRFIERIYSTWQRLHELDLGCQGTRRSGVLANLEEPPSVESAIFGSDGSLGRTGGASSASSEPQTTGFGRQEHRVAFMCAADQNDGERCATRIEDSGRISEVWLRRCSERLSAVLEHYLRSVEKITELQELTIVDSLGHEVGESLSRFMSDDYVSSVVEESVFAESMDWIAGTATSVLLSDTETYQAQPDVPFQLGLRQIHCSMRREPGTSSILDGGCLVGSDAD